MTATQDATRASVIGSRAAFSATDPSARIASGAAVAVVATVVGLWLLIGYLSQERLNAVNRTAESDVSSLVRLAHLQVDRTFQYVDGIVALAVEARRSEIAGDKTTAETLYRQLQRATIDRRFGVIQVSVVDLDGKLAWSSLVGPARDPIDLSDREHIRRILSGEDERYVSEPLLGRLSGRMSIQDAVAIQDEGERLLGVVVTSLDARELGLVLSAVSSNQRESVTLIRDDGTVLARSGSGETVGLKLDEKALEAVASGQDEVRVAAEPISGAEVFLAALDVHHHGLTVFVSSPRGAYLQTYESFRDLIDLFGLTLTAVILTGSVLVLRYNRRRAAEDSRRGYLSALQETETKFRQITETINDVVSIVDPSGRLRYVTPSIARALGYPTTGILGRTLYDCIHPDDREALGIAVATTLRGEIPRPLTLRMVEAGGGPVWMEMALEPVRGRPGDETLVLISARDIGERLAFEERLRRANEEFATVIEASPSTVYRLRMEPDGRFELLFVSPNVERLTGYGADEAVAAGRFLDRVDAKDRALVTGGWRDAMRTGEGQSLYRFRRKDGQWIWIQDRARVVRDFSSDLVEIVGHWDDVTKEKDLERRLIQASKLATLGEMATGMAHELNQPLTVIGMAVENLEQSLTQEGPMDAAVLRRLERIRKQVDRCSNLIDRMRVFGRVSKGEIGAIPIAKAIEESITIVEPKLHAIGIEVEVDVPPVIGPARGDRILFEQVIVNLLTNAADAFAGKAKELKPPYVIWIEAAETAGEIILRVRDSAGGIDEEVIGRIFEPFFSTKPVGSGTGLGLSLSYGIVTEFGGTMTVTNVAGGACFEIRLPRAPLSAETASEPDVGRPGGSARQAQPSKPVKI